ncbi:hypothetical protein [Natronolimnohabitans innermongolicus]|uniref:Uncharacterized protein n=1 Tax=Natronolimnohabitans innermongolicus JCM 12255 TaxID=1227499 RepID=L9WS57_9EURY|nr:hypothetical protein [Natronolimnohabitans innermongolicus]ELY51138.1 hypothetical protein C493_17541 [Natronolimnohabitans innermongolicus JCM 12255]
MTSDPTRRRVLQFAGAGATASLAGCTGLLGDNGELQADEEPDIDPSEGITAAVEPADEEMAALQQEIQTELEEGELDQQAAQMEMYERQSELFLERSIEFESRLAETDELTVEAAMGEMGAFLLTGSDERLVELLRDGDVSALLPGEEYAAALEGGAEAPPEAEPEPEPEPEPDDGDEERDDDDEDEDDNNGSDDDGDGADDDETDGDADDGTDDDSSDD